MKNFVFALCLMASSASAQTLDYTGFSSLEVRNDISLEIEIGPLHNVEIDASAGDIDQLTTAQFGQWLRLDRNKRWLIWTNGRRDQFSAAITMPKVDEIKALSGANIVVDVPQQERFRIEAENGAVSAHVATDSLTIRANDNSNISVAGTCERLTVRARQSAAVDLSSLTCDSIVLNGNASGVTVSEGTNIVKKHPSTDS